MTGTSKLTKAIGDFNTIFVENKQGVVGTHGLVGTQMTTGRGL